MTHEFCEIQYFETLPYLEAMQLQESLAKQVASGSHSPVLLLLEHPHTYTFGVSSDPTNLLWSEDDLVEREIEIHWSDRGGDVTYHGPGQLIGYPIVPLHPISIRNRIPRADYIGYIRRLEHVIIETLADVGIIGIQQDGFTGVWIEHQSDVERVPETAEHVDHLAKIASIGIKVDSHGVTRHGFALNVNPDMRFWEGIIACDLVDYPQVSLEQLLDPLPSKNSIRERIVDHFLEEFNFKVLN